ncbi:C-type lectin domain family 10 member A-like [Porphyrio hochstetteri]
MSQGVSTYERCDFPEGMELEKPEERKGFKGVLSLERAVSLLYLLLAFTFLLFMILTIVNLQRVSTVWEALEQARIQSENSRTTAWHNLSDIQRALDTQFSGELKAIHSQLLNVSREVGNVWQKVTRCEAGCVRELSDRLHVLEERNALETVLQQLEEVEQQQRSASVLLDEALQEARNLSKILCTRCPTGWQQFFRTCYYFSTITKPWLAAKEFCSNFNAHLVIVDSEQENKFLANHIMDNRVFWLGLSDTHKEGDWKWENGQSLSLSFWSSGEPNNVGQHGEDCATINPNGRWNDVICANGEAWICERSC